MFSKIRGFAMGVWNLYCWKNVKVNIDFILDINQKPIGKSWRNQQRIRLPSSDDIPTPLLMTKQSVW